MLERKRKRFLYIHRKIRIEGFEGVKIKRFKGRKGEGWLKGT